MTQGETIIMDAEETSQDDAIAAPSPTVKKTRVKGIHPLALLMVVVAFIALYTQRLQPEGSNGVTLWDRLVGNEPDPTEQKPTDEVAQGLQEMKERFRARQAQREKDMAKWKTASQVETTPSESTLASPQTDAVASEVKTAGKDEIKDSSASTSVIATEVQKEAKDGIKDTNTESSLEKSDATDKVAVSESTELAQQNTAHMREQALQDKIAALESQALHATKQEAFLRLYVQIETGQPYELQAQHALAIKNLSESERELILHAQDYALTGIPSQGLLIEEMSDKIRLWQMRDLPPQATMLEQTLHNLSSLVRIRKVGETHQGDDDESRIARAEAKLSQGAYDDAAEELGNLSEQSASFFGEVIDSIRAYQDAIAMVTELQSLIIAEPVHIDREF